MVRKLGRLSAVSLTKVEDEVANRIRRVPAIRKELLVRSIAFDDLVLFKGEEEIEEWVGRDGKRLNRLAQGEHPRVAGLAAIAAQQLFTPPAQQGECTRSASHFIRQIVRPSAIGINRMEVP